MTLEDINHEIIYINLWLEANDYKQRELMAENTVLVRIYERLMRLKKQYDEKPEEHVKT